MIPARPSLITKQVAEGFVCQYREPAPRPSGRSCFPAVYTRRVPSSVIPLIKRESTASRKRGARALPLLFTRTWFDSNASKLVDLASLEVEGLPVNISPAPRQESMAV